LEPGLESRLRTAVEAKLLRATTDGGAAVAGTDVSIVCVGTPSTVSGTLDLSFVDQVTREIVGAVRARGKAHTLVFRSTMLPGSTRSLVGEHAADLASKSLLNVVYYPEFLREGTAVKDFDDPSLSVAGTDKGLPMPAE